MAEDYLIKIYLDDEKTEKLSAAGLDSHITEEGGKKLIKVPLPHKNQRKFKKAFPKVTLNERTGEVNELPQDATDLLFDTIKEYRTLDVMHFFLMKAFKPLAGKEIRRAIH